MAQNTIAIVADCDETLAPDTTAQLLQACGADAEEVFRRAAELVKAGWEPTLAYLRQMVLLAQEGGPLYGLTEAKMREVGRALAFYPGVPECFAQLRQEIESSSVFRAYGIRVEFYVVSSGVEDLLAASALSGAAHAIWGCKLEYGDDGRVAFPARAISFTDKTRYLFLIQKGSVAEELKNQPYVVNEPMEEGERPIPFRNMIYLGDGPSDIPCMSLVQNNGGLVIGILSKANPGKTWALGFGRRANVTVPPEFQPGGFAYDQLREALLDRANDIKGRLSIRRPVPGY